MIKMVLVFLSLVLVSSMSFAIELRETPKGDSFNPQDFPAKGFSFKQCSEHIPVVKGKNPWLRVDKKKTKPAAMNPNPASWVESYYVSPANREKHFSIVNQEDSVYDVPTTLARIDCKNGLIYFQHVIREPVMTNTYRVLDLISGEEYNVTEGAVTISPDGNYMMTASASDRDQKCGRSPSCEVDINLFQCKKRETQGSACEPMAEKKYTVSKHGKAAAFTPLPLKWNWNKFRKELKATLGGSSRSPAKINCNVLPKFNCSVAKKGALEFASKE